MNTLEGKLIKHGHSYALKIGEKLVAFAHPGDFTNDNIIGELSLTNCQAIERGYDLDELAKREYLDGYDTTKLCRTCFKDGFQKALEILGDKKFTEDDVRRAMTHALRQYHYGALYACQDGNHPTIDNFIQSLQQTEWDVEIEMEGPLVYPANLPRLGEERPTYRPKLDQNGCLILKRKK